SSSRDWPDQNVCSNTSIARLVRMNRNVLSTTIAHTQIDATSKPIMTSFTTMCADQNNPQIDRSAETSGATGARSVGFMKNPFASSPTLHMRGPGGGSPDRRGG